jgi:hypothetical protein
MYAIDLARLQEISERYEAAKAIVRWVQDREVKRCPNVCKSLRHLFRRASVDSATRRRGDNTTVMLVLVE